MVGVRTVGLSRVTSPCANTEILSYIKSGGESCVFVLLQRLCESDCTILVPSSKHARGAEDGRGEAAECTAEHAWPRHI